MAKKFKILVNYKGMASVEVKADTVEAARRAAADLTLIDLARVGHSDIISFELAVREISEATGPGAFSDEPETSDKPRPSGWYRS